ncbi:hypothetical protein BU23DRAFT_530781 [Bimuria novae-zelandiae CBS 107.79]|uniref:Zn(2)-C6 fungal-type domain-containing protein n=1 Tax=Bimuria novae-zelandiae CBS 107.79 TaxID=1447943 RepID=A0A6A5VNW4_9PLEO|nr:hypothetical protein BU23DRAFT_530781 [Bimuria novae-zelandiae CBS 107.79]
MAAVQPQTLILEFQSLKKSRRYGAKVRTGCLTCKSRRIKCDEAKPACFRCTSTGRSCGGYVANGTMQTTRSTPSIISPLQDKVVTQSWSGDGIPYLEFYYHCAIRNLSNRFDNGFWSRTALQLARSEPSIYHALIALGYLAKTEPGNLKHAHSRLTYQDKTLNFHYSKAVGLLVERMDEKSCTVELGLVACLLFVCIEFFKGNFMTAFTHLHSGLKIISELPYIQTHGLRPRTPSPSSPRPSTKTAKIIGSTSLLEDTLIPMFMRNITPAMLFGAPIEDIFTISIPSPSTYNHPFSTFTELQNSSFQLRNASALFARTMATKIFCKTPLTHADYATQTQILDAHHAWLRALQRLESARFLGVEEEVMAASMKLGYYSTYVLVACAMSLGEMGYDNHTAYFKAINHNARIVLEGMGIATPALPISSGTRKGLSKKNAPSNHAPKTAKESPRTGHFTFEISVIPPLHFVATRCRDPLIRREALAILQTNPPREGLWDVDTHIAIARRVIEIEESRLDPATGWPAQSARLWCSVHDGKGYSDGKILVTFAFAEWAATRVPGEDDMRIGPEGDRADAQWVERIG